MERPPRGDERESAEDDERTPDIGSEVQGVRGERVTLIPDREMVQDTRAPIGDGDRGEQDAEGRGGRNDLLLASQNMTNGLIADPDCGAQDDQCLDETGQILYPPVPIGMVCISWPIGQTHGEVGEE